MSRKSAFFNWSGGKDSMLAYHYVTEGQDLDVRCFATSVSSDFDRVSMHGVRASLLRKQVELLGQRLYEISMPTMPDMEIYDQIMDQHLNILKSEGYEYSVYGDIFLEDLRIYREQKLAVYELSGVFPLWKRDSNELIQEFIDLGYRTIVVCAKEELADFCGRVIDHEFLKDLPADVDPCGENGEFHTFVFDGPLFSKPVEFSKGEKIIRRFPTPQPTASDGESARETTTGFCYIDLIEV